MYHPGMTKVLHDGWFDGHLDLAFLAETGRDMHAATDDCRGRYQPASITLPSLAEGKVRACFATLFTEAVEDPSAPGAETGAFAYPMGDADAAYRATMRQLKLYHTWRDAGIIQMLNKRGSPVPTDGPLTVGVLMEGADAIRDPDDLAEWAEGGVVMIGLTWRVQGRHAGGDATGKPLTDSGRALIPAIDDAGIVLDVSHLSQRSLDEVLTLTDRPVVASHCNCRSLLDGTTERHLSDDAIREITRRGGVIGVNLVDTFLKPPGRKGPATIDDVCDHIEHIAQLAGRRDAVALGSDADGGFPADRLPAGIRTPADFNKITDALTARGWSDSEISGFRFENWARFWSAS
jgi:membrane dipeptidase